MIPPLLYRDDTLLILDKPAGLPVDPPRAGGPSVTALLPSLRFGKRRDPRPAHRLDQDTAGCLVLARNSPAMAQLAAWFAAGAVRKTYWAVVEGAPPQPEGTLAAPLAKRSTAAAGWRMVVDPAGQAAVTDWRVLGAARGRTWLELSPRTGRTHQLRAHCAHLGCPILGDVRYGAAPGPMLQLLARAIALPTTPPIAATAAIPAHMRDALRACGLSLEEGRHLG